MGGDLGLDVEEEIFCAVCLLPFECKGRPRTASASRSRTASFSPSFTRSRAPSGSASASAPRSRSASAALDAAAPPAPFSASTPPSFSISAFFSSSPSISFDASAPRSRSASASAAGGEAREGVVPQGDIEGGFNGLNPTDGPGGPGSRQGSGSTLPPNPNENDEPVEDNNVIVRYPCHGRHYFHAHCLHSWLQVSGARYLENYNQRTMRGQNLPLNVDHREHVTCPVCREHPQNAL
ncbi:hypothetical protein B484DRAFT_458177 [Ochromonadaceae sp. CCMP2298]|nr:hypothetical protein B484DRAFT_458177 [Ochromonadaceae sp. CCMP2298]